MSLIPRRRDPEPPDWRERTALYLALHRARIAGRFAHRIWVDDWRIRIEVEPGTGIRRLIGHNDARALLRGEPLETVFPTRSSLNQTQPAQRAAMRELRAAIFEEKRS